MLNPFFLQGSKSEQNLLQDLINEHLKIYGVDVYYIPRKYITEKTVIKEVIDSEFTDAYPIEAYVQTFDGYDGAEVLMSKFGVEPKGDLNLIISKERYESYIKPLIENKENIKLSSRPKEGDLVYFPLGDRLFEIKFVEHEKPFYQLQKNYVYELRCELFRYGNEVLDTGVDEIDDNVVNEGYTRSFVMSGAGTTAYAIASIVNGGVRRVIVTNRGTGYTSAPIVNFSKSPVFGGTASGIATMISGITDFCETDSSLLRVQGVELAKTGYGYSTAPLVSFTGGEGRGASAIAEIADGIVGIITLTSAGSGYIVPPTITFSAPPAGFGTAIGRAVVSAAGTITQILVTDAGIGYTTPPTITITNPYMSGTGTYKLNEVVIGSISGTTAKVKSWDSNTKVLKVYQLDGEFFNNDVIVGSASSASYMIRPQSKYDLLDFSDPFADNKNIELEGDLIIDFSEKNPFGNP